MNTTRSLRLLTALLPLTALLSQLRAQSSWVQVPAGPPARSAHFMTFDELRSRAVLFGGYTGNGYLNDTWEHNGTAWVAMTPVVRPSARNNGAFAYDSLRGRTVLFGGYNGTSWYNDTWSWNGTTWTLLPTSAAPTVRAGVAMAYDRVRDRIVLFGGAVNATRIAETWEFNGTTWQQQFVNGPAGRSAHSMVYDEALGAVVMFGGSSTAGLLNDTWTWNGASWQQVAFSPAPPARYQFAMAYDRNRGRSIVFGGNSSAGVLSDTWLLTGTTWSQWTGAAMPGARNFARMVNDDSRDAMLLFAGVMGSPVADCWEHGPTARASYRLLSRGCSGSAGIATLQRQATLPWIGSQLQVQLGGMPGPIGVAMLGLGITASPIDLTAVGMSGCILQSNPSAIQVLVTQNGIATAALPIPNVPTLLGAAFYQQALVVDPAASNPVGAVVSDAARGVVGMR